MAKIMQLENKINDAANNDFDEVLKKLKNMESAIKNKLDCDTFDGEIASLRDMIANLEPGIGSAP